MALAFQELLIEIQTLRAALLLSRGRTQWHTTIAATILLLDKMQLTKLTNNPHCFLSLVVIDAAVAAAVNETRWSEASQQVYIACN